MEKERILENVINYLCEKDQPKLFVKGESEVPVSGGKLSNFDILQLVNCALDGWITESKWSDKFRKELTCYTGFHHAVLCNSGSSANLLAMNGVKEHYNITYPATVLTSALAFPTTVAPIFQTGLIPCFIDIDLATLNPSLNTIQHAIEEKKPAGIILAHTMGFPYNAEKIHEICKAHDMFFIQDCADALGANTADGKSLSEFGDCATLSFFPAHQILTGEGGTILCNSGRLFNTIRSYSSWGRECVCKPGESNSCGKRFDQQNPNMPEHYDHKYIFVRIGYNLKMTDLQAAIGLSQMGRIKEIVRDRRTHYKFLWAGLTNIPKFYDHFSLFHCPSNSSPFGFPVLVKNNNRYKFVQFMETRKIRTRPIFAGNITRQPMLAHGGYDWMGILENADNVMENAVWIGVQPELSIEQLEYVVESFADYIHEQN